MNTLISEDDSCFKHQQLIENDIPVHEYLLNSLLPQCDQLYSEDTAWTLGNIPIYINNASEVQSISDVLPEEESYQNLQNVAMNINATNINSNVITSSIYLPNDVLILNPNYRNDRHAAHLKENSNTQNIQVLEQSIFRNQKLIVSNDVSEQIEMVSAHKCKICEQLFERYDAITAHIQGAHASIISPVNIVVNAQKEEPKNLYLCGKCDERSIAYESIEHLKEHMKISHNLIDKSSEQSISSIENDLLTDELLRKMIQNQDIANKKVKCMIKGCDNSFASKEVMLKHMEFHTEGTKKKFKCHVCFKLFFIWRTCRAHIWKAHKIDVGLYECSMCKSFKCFASYDLLAHMKIHSNPKNFKPFLCSTCGEQFNRLAELQNHFNSHVKAKTWDVNCPKCDKSFANNKYLKRHIQSVHDQYKPFICNICGHKCARKSMLDLHLRQHTGEKPYKCELCVFKTGDHNSFRRHALRHAGLATYTCQFCEYSTIQSNAFKLHMKRKHPGKGGFFSCTTCSFNTVNEKLYQQHIDKHKREKPLTVLDDTADITKDSTVPNVEDEETQIGLFPDHLEDTVDTGGITIPAIETN